MWFFRQPKILDGNPAKAFKDSKAPLRENYDVFNYYGVREAKPGPFLGSFMKPRPVVVFGIWFGDLGEGFDLVRYHYSRRKIDKVIMKLESRPDRDPQRLDAMKFYRAKLDSVLTPV